MQEEEAPEIFQLSAPLGLAAPTIPETVAVKVRVSPKRGLLGAVVMAIVGIALVTLTLSGVAELCEE